MLYGASQTGQGGEHDQFTDVTVLITEVHIFPYKLPFGATVVQCC